jgi:hypothetical protein
MTEVQRLELIRRFPGAAAKARRLDPAGDLDDPHGGDRLAHLDLGVSIRRHVEERLRELMA